MPVARVSVGVPVTLTASLNVTVIAINWVALYEPSVRAEVTLVTVGAVLSTVRSVPALNSTVRALPAASVIAGVTLARLTRIVPSPVPVLTATVQVAPEPVTPVIEAPLTPDVVRLKFAASTPKAAWSNVTVKFAVAPLLNVEVGAIDETVGAVRSTDTDWAPDVPLLPAVSACVAVSE